MEKLKRLYLRFEKGIIPIFLFVVLASAFYYIDWTTKSRAHGDLGLFEPRTFVDDLSIFRFSPPWIWIYLSYYFLVFAPLFVMRDIKMFRRVSLSFFLQYGFAFFVFLGLPSRMERPIPGVDFALDTLSARAVAWFYGIDPGYNVFPSMHVANIFFVAFLIYRFHKKAGLALHFVSILVTISTLAVKQHYFVDLPAGFAVALAAYWISMRGWVDESARGLREEPRLAAATPGDGNGREAALTQSLEPRAAPQEGTVSSTVRR